MVTRTDEWWKRELHARSLVVSELDRWMKRYVENEHTGNELGQRDKIKGIQLFLEEAIVIRDLLQAERKDGLWPSDLKDRDTHDAMPAEIERVIKAAQELIASRTQPAESAT